MMKFVYVILIVYFIFNGFFFIVDVLKFMEMFCMFFWSVNLLLIFNICFFFNFIKFIVNLFIYFFCVKIKCIICVYLRKKISVIV